MSYDFDIIAITYDRAAARADLHAHFSARSGFEQLPSQYGFRGKTGEEGFLVELIDADDFEDVDTEDEEDPRIAGWIAINYFQSREFYEEAATEVQALLAGGKFTLYDPQSEESYTDSFPEKEFVDFMMSIRLD